MHHISAIECSLAACEELSTVVWGGVILRVCGECGLRANTLTSCPKVVKFETPVTKKEWSQSKKSQEIEIKKAKIMQEIRKEESYEKMIKRLSKKYNKNLIN